MGGEVDGNKFSRIFKEKELAKSLEQIKNEHLDKNQTQDREQRKKYTKYTFILCVTYIFLVFLIVFLSGFQLMDVSNSVLIVLLSSSFAQIIGLFVFVMKYLFNIKN